MGQLGQTGIHKAQYKYAESTLKKGVNISCTRRPQEGSKHQLYNTSNNYMGFSCLCLDNRTSSLVDITSAVIQLITRLFSQVAFIYVNMSYF